MRKWIAAVAALTISLPFAAPAVVRLIYSGPQFPGCKSYIPVDQPLIAHAGGGLPEKTYANNLKAIELAANHGFEFIELDFMVSEGEVIIRHDGHPASDLTVPALTDWLRKNPSISVVTDFKSQPPSKSANIDGLKLLRPIVSDLQKRFIPQIYKPDEYEAVREMGYPAPIMTLYRIPEGREPVEMINKLDLHAVTMPVERAYLAGNIGHPVYLHTVNEPMPGYGLYTDCLIPA